MKMKTLIILAVLLLITVAIIAVLNHPCFGRRMSKERKARIEASPNWRDGQFQNQIPTPQFTGDKSMFGAVWEFLSERKKDSFMLLQPLKKTIPSQIFS